jgi:hypothetical protein
LAQNKLLKRKKKLGAQYDKKKKKKVSHVVTSLGKVRENLSQKQNTEQRPGSIAQMVQHWIKSPVLQIIKK